MSLAQSRRAVYPRAVEASAAPADAPLQGGNGNGTFDGMEADISTRLGRLEGALPAWKWGISVVSAVMIGGLGIVVAILLSLQGQVTQLPSQINANMLEVTRTLSTAITAARENEASPPTVIVVPQMAPDAAEANSLP